MRLILLINMSFLLFVSCGKYKDDGGQVTGKVGELLVVCDEEIWGDEEICSALDSAFTRFILPYFPDVPTFELKHRSFKNFDGALKRHRNVLIINQKSNIENGAECNKISDVWARNQTLFEINFSNKSNLIRFLKSRNTEVIHNEYSNNEWRRILEYYKANNNQFISQKLKDNFKINLNLPSGSGIVTSRNNFFRIEFPPGSRPIDFENVRKQDLGAVWEGVLVYQYDFIDSSQLSLDNLLKARDTMLRYNVPHEIEGLYMGTQYVDMVYPEINVNTNYNKTIKGIEMRGMFAFVGKPIHTTGGAFWGFHFIHPNTKKIICVSGYLDAPSTTSWTHFMREIQAVWKSVSIDG